MTLAARNLDYAPPPGRRRRWLRRARTWVPLAAAVLAACRYGPSAYYGARFTYLQWACGRFTASPSTVVCDEPARFGGITKPFLTAAADPEPLATLGELNSAIYGCPSVFTLPVYRPAWSGWFAGTKVNRDWPLLFVHWRATPGGRERLVIVRRTPPAFRESWDAPLAFHVATVPRVRPWERWPEDRSKALPEVVPQVFADDPGKVAVRFYAGQPDPADPSRFTVGFEADGEPGTLVGRLVDAPDEPGGVRVELSTK